MDGDLNDVVHTAIEQGCKGIVKVGKQLNVGVMQAMEIEISFGPQSWLLPAGPRVAKINMMTSYRSREQHRVWCAMSIARYGVGACTPSLKPAFSINDRRYGNHGFGHRQTLL